MKAYLKSKNKLLDVVLIGKTPKQNWYKDTLDGKVYPADELEFKEYYGG